MKRHVILLAALLLASLAGIASAATPAVKRGTARAARTSAPVRAHPPAGARTLQDIHIEGEIPVPQVLFITAREQRRFMEFQYGRYLRTSQKLGEDTILPSTIVVTRTQPGAKETPR